MSAKIYIDSLNMFEPCLQTPILKSCSILPYGHMGSSQISKKLGFILGFDVSRFAEPRQWSKALAVVEILQQSGIEPYRSLAGEDFGDWLPILMANLRGKDDDGLLDLESTPF